MLQYLIDLDATHSISLPAVLRISPSVGRTCLLLRLFRSKTPLSIVVLILLHQFGRYSWDSNFLIATLSQHFEFQSRQVSYLGDDILASLLKSLPGALATLFCGELPLNCRGIHQRPNPNPTSTPHSFFISTQLRK